MAKERKKTFNKLEVFTILALTIVTVAVILLLTVGKPNQGDNDGFSINDIIQVSGIELINNKEKYEGVELTIMNVLVLDPLFVYIEFPEGGGERLFIEPRKSEYCLYFNLKGELNKDEKREWIFRVSDFECVSRT